MGLDNGYFARYIYDMSLLPEKVLDTQYFIDLRDVEAEHLEGVDGIVHLAEVSNDPIGNEFSRATTQINIGGTKRLIDLAVRLGVNCFVFASSCSVYGAAGSHAKL